MRILLLLLLLNSFSIFDFNFVIFHSMGSKCVCECAVRICAFWLMWCFNGNGFWFTLSVNIIIDWKLQWCFETRWPNGPLWLDTMSCWTSNISHIYHTRTYTLHPFLPFFTCSLVCSSKSYMLTIHRMHMRKKNTHVVRALIHPAIQPATVFMFYTHSRTHEYMRRSQCQWCAMLPFIFRASLYG